MLAPDSGSQLSAISGWTDFRFIAERYQIVDRDAQIAMATEVSASIASAARKLP